MFVSYDDKLAAIAAAEPAFGGLYNDAGVLTVVVTDTTRPPEAVRSAITRVLNVPRFRSMPIRLRLGRYGFAQLYTWNKSLPGQSSIPGVISYGVDQVQNRITIGVRNDATAALMRQALAARAIPAEAVIIFTRPPIYFTSSLGDRLRDIWGGPHMDFSTSAGSWCTLGLVVKDTTGRMLAATNGHCSNSWGTGYDGTPYWQASRSSSSDSIGVEGRESIVYYNSQDSSCKYGDACKLSDISFVVLDSTAAANSEVGYLYKPTVRSRFDSSLTVGTTPLQIENKQLYPTVGDTVDKIGARTGWTYGPVTATCQYITVTDANTHVQYQFPCANEATLGLYGGDSGSAVFSYDATNNAASIVGQLFAGDSTVSGSVFYHRTYFASVENIQAEMGTLIMTIYGWF